MGFRLQNICCLSRRPLCAHVHDGSSHGLSSSRRALPRKIKDLERFQIHGRCRHESCGDPPCPSCRGRLSGWSFVADCHVVLFTVLDVGWELDEAQRTDLCHQIEALRRQQVDDVLVGDAQYASVKSGRDFTPCAEQQCDSPDGSNCSYW